MQRSSSGHKSQVSFEVKICLSTSKQKYVSKNVARLVAIYAEQSCPIKRKHKRPSVDIKSFRGLIWSWVLQRLGVAPIIEKVREGRKRRAVWYCWGRPMKQWTNKIREDMKSTGSVASLERTPAIEWGGQTRTKEKLAKGDSSYFLEIYSCTFIIIIVIS